MGDLGARPLGDQAQQRPSGPDLDVVGVGAEADHAQRLGTPEGRVESEHYTFRSTGRWSAPSPRTGGAEDAPGATPSPMARWAPQTSQGAWPSL